jgi:hypothetical protein
VDIQFDEAALRVIAALRRVVRVASVVTAIALTSLSLTSCRQGPSMRPAAAKDAVVSITQRTADALGGEWTVSSGPRLGKCPARLGGEGVTYVYILVRSAGDPEADIQTAADLWEREGMEVGRYQSGGDDPTLGIIGRGGPASSIDFNASKRGYTLDAVSPCAEGDFSQMLGDE